MNSPYLIITSVSSSENHVLQQYASESYKHGIKFVVIGDTKSPKDFELENCDFFSIERQLSSGFELASLLPEKHYSRKNIGYLIAIADGCEVIIETDDDNIPFEQFWKKRVKNINTHVIQNTGWVNVYKYFSDVNIWPRGFSLEKINDALPKLNIVIKTNCPIQQGLADLNPDVDAIYRLILPLPINFHHHTGIALGNNSWCPFNSQNTTWFKEAFPLLYLPSFCSFRMTDIWRSFIAQRIAWTCDWNILFHNASVYQERNFHNLIYDFQDEVQGYLNNEKICDLLQNINLKTGYENIYDNLNECYKLLVKNNFINKKELTLVDKWINDCSKFIKC